MSDAFDWNNLSDDKRVVDTVQAVAVYYDERGSIVIRQEATWDESDDSYIVLPVNVAETLIKKLRTLIDER